MADFELTPVEVFYNLLRQHMAGAKTKVMFKGDMNVKSDDYLPLITIDLLSVDEWRTRSSGIDQATENIRIKVTISKLNYRGHEHPNEDLVLTELIHIIQGEKNGTLDPQSIMGILRSNLTIEAFNIDQIGAIEYPESNRDADKEQAEGWVDLTITRRISIQRTT